MYVVEDLAEVKTIEVSKAITDPATKKGMKDVADTITGVATELVTGNTAKLVTGNTAELVTGNAVELITRDTTELGIGDATKLRTENVTETITEKTEIITDKTKTLTENVMDGTIENMSNDEQHEEEKKPVLRLRSFAKPPTTWEDNQHKIDKTTQKKVTTLKIANQVKEVVDLTNEGTTKLPIITNCSVQLGEKIIPIVKRQLVIPRNKNIISVQNITNNYLKVNTRTGQIIAPVRDIRTGSTIIRLPIQNINRQSQSQNVNAITVRNEIPLKKNEILKIIPQKSVIISKKSTVKPVSKQMDVNSSTTNSK